MHSAPFDLGLVVGPPLLAALAVLLIPALRAPETPPWGWALFVVGVDVAHVWGSLYRTYLDREELARRRRLYALVPFLCWALGALLYRLGELAFWRALAYLAVFHFVRQQYGFLRLYQQLHGGGTRWDARLDRAAIYATMLYPLAFWHAHPDRLFAWFVAGDFAPLPASLATAAGWAYGVLLALFALRQLQLAARGEAPCWGKIGVVASTAAAWYVGIVLLNSDFAFTVTNVVAHGVPYFALVWLYGNRRWRGTGLWLEGLHRPAAAVGFLALLLALAYCEEGLWDLFVWREHAGVFWGLTGLWDPALATGALALLVPLLAVPQMVHYVSDAWLWKFDGSNPGLREHLALTPPVQ